PTPTATPSATPTPRPSASPSPTPSPSRPPSPSPTPTATPPPPTPPPGSGPLANGGFESGSLAPWTCSSLDAVVASPVHAGSHALAAAASSSDNAQCTQVISVLPGH